MTDNVHELHFINYRPETAETLLEKAKLLGLERCMVIGVDANGDHRVAASFSEKPEMVYMLEVAKKALLDTP